MGAQCVRQSPKTGTLSLQSRPLNPHKFRDSDQQLHFHINISDLQLHYPAKNVAAVIFQAQRCFAITFRQEEFTIHEKMIKCVGNRKAQFSVCAKEIQFLNFTVDILDSHGNSVQKVCLKMHAVCEGPKHHDHLLKEMKARIIYNFQISQIVSLELSCENFSMSEARTKKQCDCFGFSLQLLVPDEESSDNQEEPTIYPKNPEESIRILRKSIPTQKLRKSIIRIIVYRVSIDQLPPTNHAFSHVYLPYLKFQSQCSTILIEQISKQKTMEKRKLKYYDLIEQDDIQFQARFDIICKSSKVYLQQIQCLVFSENGLNTVSPHLLMDSKGNCEETVLELQDLIEYEAELKKERKVTYQNKQNIQKNIKECYHLLCKKDKCCPPLKLESIQLKFVNMLNSLSKLITEGEDVTNESIWTLIDKIIHRPELSTRYLYLFEDGEQKKQLALKYYSFLCGVLTKIIQCTTVGLTYHELKCIQKFIAYTFFRCNWIREVIISVLSREDDPVLTPQKLMEIGVFAGCKSPSKALVYDWDLCMPYLHNQSKIKEMFNELKQSSEQIPHWAQLLFNRQDDDLFYGLLIEIWTEGEIFLNNQGRIMWEYFPCYAQLLATFLGEMNRNKIMEYSKQFRECSMKLISNQKLLNNFVMFLFPKTCLYETYCVIKCLELIHSYFCVISQQKKKMPKEFNFNYFYTGIRCIFESNHSYLLIRVICLLYDYYHIFSVEFKKSLDEFVLGKGFFHIFLHWCGHVRKMFYLLLEHKIAVKFRDHQLKIKNETSEHLVLSFQSIQRMHQYKSLIDQLQRERFAISQTKKMEKIPTPHLPYHQQMKVKLAMKRKGRVCVSPTKPISMINSAYFETPESRRGHNQNEQKWSSDELDLDFMKMNRKWSLDIGAENESVIPNNLKKYVICALKEFEEIKNIANPNEEVKKITKIFQGGKSVDN